MRVIFFVVIYLIIPYLGFSQINLKDSLLLSVKECHNAITDEDNDARDVVIINDIKNAYLHVSGSWPTCGCYCSETAKGYKKSNGRYLILKNSSWSCTGEAGIFANENLSKILPADFGLNIFARKSLSITDTIAYFYFTIQIPQKGTETKISIKLVPFGIMQRGLNGVTYAIKEEAGKSRNLHLIKELAKEGNNNGLLMRIINGGCETMTIEDKMLVNKYIGERDDQIASLSELQSCLRHLYTQFSIYNQLKYTSLILSWDKKAGKFFIKEKTGVPIRLNFLNFLLKNEYWSPIC